MRDLYYVSIFNSFFFILPLSSFSLLLIDRDCNSLASKFILFILFYFFFNFYLFFFLHSFLSLFPFPLSFLSFPFSLSLSLSHSFPFLPLFSFCIIGSLVWKLIF